MPNFRPRTSLYLWEFLLELLDSEEPWAEISWVNRDKGIFVLKDQDKIAKLWGEIKGRPQMDKIKLGRAMRYYYKKKFLAKVPRQKGVYRFTKLNVLKQNQETLQTASGDLPEIDINDDEVLVLTGDESTVYKNALGIDPEEKYAMMTERTKKIPSCTNEHNFLLARFPSDVIPFPNLDRSAGEGSWVVDDEANDQERGGVCEFPNQLDNFFCDHHSDDINNFNNNHTGATSERLDESFLFNYSIDLALFV